MSTEQPEGTFKVWHIPQVPMEPFEIEPVETLEEAIVIMDALAYYDLFQHAHKIKPDYSNAQGVARVEGGEWWDVDESEIDESRSAIETLDDRTYTP